MSPLISTESLAEQIGAPNLRLFDASYYLPAEQRDARALYAEAHIPTAQFFDIDAIADDASSLPHTVPSAARFERLVQMFGCGELRSGPGFRFVRKCGNWQSEEEQNDHHPPMRRHYDLIEFLQFCGRNCFCETAIEPETLGTANPYC